MLFFESEDTEVFKADRNKLVASNEKKNWQIHTLINAWHASLKHVSCVYLPS